MKNLSKLSLVITLMAFAMNASALVVTYHYDKYATKLYAGVREDIKEECCDNQGKSYGYKTIDVFANGTGNSECKSSVKIMAKRTNATSQGEIDLLAYLQGHAVKLMDAGKKKGSYKEFFTVTNDGREASKAYKVSWVISKNGSAIITITDQL